METLIHADIFFFIASVATIVIAGFAAVALYYLIKFLRTIDRLGRTIEDKAEDIGEEAEEFIEDIRESFLFRLMFPRHPRSKKKKGKK